MSCTNKIGAAINAGCPTPNRGFAEEVLIANFDEIATKTFNVDTAIASDIVMGAGKKFYSAFMQTKKPFDGTKITGVEKLFGWLFDNETKIVITGNTPANSELINTMVNGRFVMIFKQVGVSDNSKYPVMGLEIGLKVSAAELVAYDDNGGWSVTLTEEMCQSAGMFVWKTDLATTDALWASLKA